MDYGKIIEFLDGKKTTIATIFGAIITFALGRGAIQSDTAELLATILVAIGYGSNFLTNKYWAMKEANGDQVKPVL